MNLTELSNEQLIDIVHRQADDIAALQFELSWLKEQDKLAALPEREALKLQPVEVNGELWYFTCPRWQKNGKTVTAYQLMNDEDALKKIVADPHQMILKKSNY